MRRPSSGRRHRTARIGGGHFRQDYPEKNPACATFNISVRRAADGTMQVARVPIPAMPDELKQVIEENK